MFNTLGSFSTFYLSLSAILVAMVLFKNQCLALEDKFDAWVAKKKGGEINE